MNAKPKPINMNGLTGNPKNWILYPSNITHPKKKKIVVTIAKTWIAFVLKTKLTYVI
jgi:hypothetical protein